MNSSNSSCISTVISFIPNFISSFSCIICSCLLICTLLTNRKQQTNFKKIAFSLTVTDAIGAINSLIQFSYKSIIACSHKDLSSQTFCTVTLTIHLIFTIAEPLQTLVISIDRAIAIYTPAAYHSARKFRLSRLNFISVLIAIVIGVCGPIIGTVKVIPLDTVCAASAIFTNFYFNLAKILSGGLIGATCLCYILIVIKRPSFTKANQWDDRRKKMLKFLGFEIMREVLFGALPMVAVFIMLKFKPGSLLESGPYIIAIQFIGVSLFFPLSVYFLEEMRKDFLRLLALTRSKCNTVGIFALSIV